MRKGNPPRGVGRLTPPPRPAPDRDADRIRQQLRAAGFHDVDNDHLDGFTVDTGDADGRSRVTYRGDRILHGPVVSETLAGYRRALEASGHRVDVDPGDPSSLIVRPAVGGGGD